MFAFTATAITAKAATYEAEYAITPEGAVVVFVKLPGRKFAQPVRIERNHAMYREAVKAAIAAGSKAPAGFAEAASPAKPEAKPAKPAAKRKGAKPAAPAKPEAVAEKPAETPAKPEAKPVKPAAPAKPEAKPAAKPAKPAKQAAKRKDAKPATPTAPAKPEKPAFVVGDKSFIGTTITGNGYAIAFDAAAGRTRLTLTAEPTAPVKAAIAAAGFYWAPSTASYNKGLTCKAHRAAVALAAQLDKLIA